MAAMRRVRGRSKSVLTVAFCLVFLCARSDAGACSTSSIPTEIGRAFTVKVQDRGKPLVGLEIELSTDPGDRPVSVINTDTTGVAQFSKVHPGLYYVAIKHPAFPCSKEIRVMRRAPKGSQDTVSFEWPGWPPLSIQEPSGVLRGRARTNRPVFIDKYSKPVYGRVAGAKLTLSKTVSNETISFVTTGESGTFDFGDVPPGLYFLRVETPVTNPVRWLYPPDGYVPLEINRLAKLKKLNLVLDNAVCGELGWGSEEDDTPVDAETN
jgi:hypothetical protein